MGIASILSALLAAAQQTGPLGSRSERTTVKIVMGVAAVALVAVAAGVSAAFPRHRKRLAIVCFVLGGAALALAGVANYGVLSEDAEVSGIITLAAGATGLGLLVVGGTFYRAHKDAQEEAESAGE